MSHFMRAIPYLDKYVLTFHSSAAPVVFTRELENQTVDEGCSVTLNCEISKPDVCVEWRKGELCLSPCAKYEITQTGCLAALVIHDVDDEDSGSYTCDTAYRQSTAQVAVNGMPLKHVVCVDSN